jgi:hypothetical protein
MAGTLTPVQVIVDYTLRGPQLVRATDSDDPHAPERRNRGKASTDLLQQVFTKILAHRQHGTPIQLALDDDGYIIPDLGPSMPAASAHLDAARTATLALHQALDGIEEAITPKRTRRRGTGPGRGPGRRTGKGGK